MRNNALWAAAALSFGASAALAATDGTLSTTSSTASMSVSAEIVGRPNGVKVSGVQDINFGVLSNAQPGRATQEICLYHSSPTVAIEARKPGDAGGTVLFLRTSNPSNLWALKLETYIVRSDGSTESLGGTGYVTRNQTFNRQSENCQTGGRTTLRFEVDTAQLFGASNGATLDEAPAGVYTADIQLVLTPE